MAYDPQRYRRRPKPSADEPAPIETILDAEESTISTVPSDRAPSSPVLDDPPFALLRPERNPPGSFDWYRSC